MRIIAIFGLLLLPVFANAQSHTADDFNQWNGLDCNNTRCHVYAIDEKLGVTLFRYTSLLIGGFYTNDYTDSDIDTLEYDFDVYATELNSCDLAVITTSDDFGGSDIAGTDIGTIENNVNETNYSGSVDLSSSNTGSLFGIRVLCSSNDSVSLKFNSLIADDDELLYVEETGGIQNIYIPVEQNISSANCIDNASGSECSFEYSTTTIEESEKLDIFNTFILYLFFISAGALMAVLTYRFI